MERLSKKFLLTVAILLTLGLIATNYIWYNTVNGGGFKAAETGGVSEIGEGPGGGGTECGVDDEPRDIPDELTARSKVPADASLEPMPAAVEAIGPAIEKSPELAELYAAIDAATSVEYSSQSAAQQAIDAAIKEGLRKIGVLFTNSSTSLIDRFTDNAFNASKGIYLFKFREFANYRGPVARKDVFSMKEKNLNVRFNIEFTPLVLHGQTFARRVQLNLGAEYIVHAQKDGFKISVLSSIYTRCDPPWQENEYETKWQGRWIKPFLRAQIPVLINKKIGYVTPFVEFSPFSTERWEKKKWSFGVKIGGSGGNQQ